ncbi:MAG: WecB/TagA/CpsF family glycosyltransferase [Pseudomonadota bacterium]
MDVALRHYPDRRYCIAGIPVDALCLEDACDAIHDAAAGGGSFTLSTPNLNFLRTALADQSFRESLLTSELCLVDGMPLLWLARLLGIPVPERVAGSTLFERLQHDVRPLKVFFFGGPEGAAKHACDSLEHCNGLECAGSSSPGIGTVDQLSRRELLDQINDSDADFLILALGAAKGQAWILQNRARLNIPVVSHLGAVVNFAAGTVRRAPQWMQRVGLEWLWRIREEPSLWRRYFHDAVALFRVTVLRVLPYRLWLTRNKDHATEALSAAIDCRGQDLEVRLQGSCSEQYRATFAEVTEAASSVAGEVRLDMGSVSYLDPAGLGLLLSLEGLAKRRERMLRVTQVAPGLRRVFRWNAMDHLLIDSVSQPSGCAA